MSGASSRNEDAESISRKRFLQGIAFAGTVGAAGLAGLSFAEPLIPRAQAGGTTDVDVAGYTIDNESGTIKAYNGQTGSVDYSGGPDAAPVINNAIAALTSGGMVYLKPATYIIQSTVKLGSGIRLVGAGRAATVLKRNSGTFTMIDYAPTSDTSGLGILDLQLLHNGGSGVGILGTYGLQFSEIRNVEVNGVDKIGIQLNGSDNILEGCFIRNTTGKGINPLVYYSYSRNRIINNYLDNCGSYAAQDSSIDIQGNSQTPLLGDLILGNTIVNSPSHAIDVDATRGTRVIGNYIISPGYHGIFTDGYAIECIVANNVIENAAGRGILLSPGSNRFIVSGNRVTGCGDSGIDVDGGSNGTYDVVIQGNISINNVRGINLFDEGTGVQRCLITGNSCSDTRTGSARTQTYGIREANNGNNNYIISNYLNNNITAPVSWVGPTTAVYHNFGLSA